MEICRSHDKLPNLTTLIGIFYCKSSATRVKLWALGRISAEVAFPHKDSAFSSHINTSFLCSIVIRKYPSIFRRIFVVQTESGVRHSPSKTVSEEYKTQISFLADYTNKPLNVIRAHVDACKLINEMEVLK